MTKARAFLKELEALDGLNGSAEYHRNVEITQDTRSAYAKGGSVMFFKATKPDRLIVKRLTDAEYEAACYGFRYTASREGWGESLVGIGHTIEEAVRDLAVAARLNIERLLDTPHADYCKCPQCGGSK